MIVGSNNNYINKEINMSGLSHTFENSLSGLLETKNLIVQRGREDLLDIWAKDYDTRWQRIRRMNTRRPIK